jgi:hypothetical protein
LTLFVGDHGELSRGKVRESAITLWQMQRTGSGAKASWRSDPKEILTVSELRAALDAGLGRGRVVFCFTCCHSGGFHHLDAPRAAPANPAWFRGLQPVACADWTETPAPARIAGFTATTEDSLAAGCDPDPDPEKWRGYERLFPEALLGVDLMSGKKLAPALSNFAAAHTAATLVDRTIDKPFRTSEAWLERYATLIETVLAESPALTPAVRAQVERYHRIVNGEAPGVSDPAFLAQQQQTERFLAALAEQNPSVALVLLAGTRADLTPAPETTSGGSRRRTGAPTNIRKLWSETIRPAWKAALVAKKVADIPEAARAFELQLIALEEKTPTKIFLPGDRDAVRNELFWRSGYAQVDAKNQARAAVVARWEAGRRAAILAWARASSDEKIRAAALTWRSTSSWVSSRCAGRRSRRCPRRWLASPISWLRLGRTSGPSSRCRCRPRRSGAGCALWASDTTCSDGRRTCARRPGRGVCARTHRGCAPGRHGSRRRSRRRESRTSLGWCSRCPTTTCPTRRTPSSTLRPRPRSRPSLRPSLSRAALG